MIEVDESEVTAMLDDAIDALEIRQADLDEIADLLVFRILDRTRRGVDIYGVALDGYAAATKRSRRKRGREVSRVTLQDSGRMLAALRGRSDGDAALVYFASRTEGKKAAWLDEGTRHMPERRFMDASQADLDAAAKVLLDRITQRL